MNNGGRTKKTSQRAIGYTTRRLAGSFFAPLKEEAQVPISCAEDDGKPQLTHSFIQP